jgi:hypothetical protein
MTEAASDCGSGRLLIEHYCAKECRPNYPPRDSLTAFPRRDTVRFGDRAPAWKWQNAHTSPASPTFSVYTEIPASTGL